MKNKWVSKLKKDGDKLVKYKAWLVVKGFSQKQGIDFDEIFSPVVKMSSIRVVLGLIASFGSWAWATWCEDSFSSWWFERRNLHGSARGIRSEREKTHGLQVKEEFVWLEASSKIVVQEVWLIHGGSRVHKDKCRSLCVC